MSTHQVFLTNIDYNVENMDFLLYIQHYTKLFEAVADEERAALSLPWTKQDEEAAKKAINNINKAAHKPTPSIPMAQSNLPTPPGSSGEESSMEDLKYDEQHSTPADCARFASMGRSMSDADMESIAPFARHDNQYLHPEESITEGVEGAAPGKPRPPLCVWSLRANLGWTRLSLLSPLTVPRNRRA